MTPETKAQVKELAIEVLRIAAKYIREHCPDEKIVYDKSTYDGDYIADDCNMVAEMLEAIK